MNKKSASDFTGISFDKEDTSYIAPTWQEMGEYCFGLSQKIIQKKLKFDRLVTLAKGGWTWSRTMTDLLHINKVASVQIEFYTHVGKTSEKPVLIQSLPVEVSNERILVFDDVVDTGKSLPFCKQYLQMCGARSITTASLFYKPWAQYKPDFYMCQTRAWIIFPHEVREAIYDLTTRWFDSGLKLEQIKERFAKIGLPKKEVDFFTSVIFNGNGKKTK